ncbi:MAG: hypothetical protein ACLQQ4_01450 [Bacteroidia bacterium]
MNAQVVNPFVIPKENIGGLQFPAQEVLSLPDEIKQRKANAQKGLLLGNNYKCKVKMIFEDSESLKQVITTIWGLTDMHVILKGGITIPLNRIYSIDICP